ncbi:TAXI family TRAP transporter solute-binding subunit [Alteribacillus sp. YIM 98480]|uniref:TAXI family TRAP transporter solute-binding subunit n=1 Tax=Alteribacillus sp. YIM 98480 TaxID=2606599 RepID=UPI00131AB7DB|nr:TAXI family TRAP transporter solute-binding subunit [Alteribacillus sp. YIM 98480]
MQPNFKLFLGFLLMIVLMLGGCGQEEQAEPNSSEGTDVEQSGQLALATFGEGTSWYIYGATMGEIFRENIEEIQMVDVLPFAGGLENINILSDGEADLALSFSLNNTWAANGDVAYENAHDEVRTLVGGLDQYYIGILMPTKLVEENDIQSIGDIKEKELPIRLYTLSKGSQGEIAAQQVLDAYGITYEDIESYGGEITHTTLDVTKSDFQNGKVDMYFNPITAGHPAFSEITVQSDVTFIPIEEEYIEDFTEMGYEAATLPANQFEGQDNEVQTIGMSTVLDGTTNLSEDVAYELTKAMVENEESLQDGHQALKDFDPKTFLEKPSEMELHPGAEKYYKEKGWLE